MYAVGVILSELVTGTRMARPRDVDAARQPDERPLLEHEGVRDLLVRLLQPTAQGRLSAEAVLSLSWVQAPPPQYPCALLCMGQHHPVTQGVLCSNREPGVNHGHPHFMCNTCFGQHVSSLAQEELRKLEARQAQAVCYARQEEKSPCQAVFSDVVVAQHCNDAVFKLHVAARLKLEERKLAQDMERDHRQQLAAELTRLRNMDEQKVRLDIYLVVYLLLTTNTTSHVPLEASVRLSLSLLFVATCSGHQARHSGQHLNSAMPSSWLSGHVYRFQGMLCFDVRHLQLPLLCLVSARLRKRCRVSQPCGALQVCHRWCRPRVTYTHQRESAV